jgi:hypothetical protein
VRARQSEVTEPDPETVANIGSCPWLAGVALHPATVAARHILCHCSDQVWTILNAWVLARRVARSHIEGESCAL